MHHPERRFVYYGFSQVQPTKVFVEGTFISHTLSLCFLLSFMASQAKISSDPAVLLEYMEGLSCVSESDDGFDGYLGPEDGPVACATVPKVVEREGLCSLSTDDLTTAEVSELSESPFTSSVSPMQDQRYRLQVKLTQATLLFLTLQLNQLLRYAKVPLSSREQRKLVTWYKRFQGCIVKGLLTKKTSFPPR